MTMNYVILLSVVMAAVAGLAAGSEAVSTCGGDRSTVCATCSRPSTASSPPPECCKAIDVTSVCDEKRAKFNLGKRSIPDEDQVFEEDNNVEDESDELPPNEDVESDPEYEKRGRSPFLGKRRSPFLGKRRSPFLGKRRSPFLGKRRNPFLGKRTTDDDLEAFADKRRMPFLGK